MSSEIEQMLQTDTRPALTEADRPAFRELLEKARVPAGKPVPYQDMRVLTLLDRAPFRFGPTDVERELGPFLPVPDYAAFVTKADAIRNGEYDAENNCLKPKA